MSVLQTEAAKPATGLTDAGLFGASVAALVDQGAGRPAGVAEPQRIRDLRSAAGARFDELGLPTTRQEEWRFTNVTPISRAGLRLAETGHAFTSADVEPYVYAGCHQLVFGNGRLIPELSRLDSLPDGVVVCGMAEALERYPEKLAEWLGRFTRFQDHPFAALNTALWADGVFVEVPDGLILDQPVNIIFAGDAESGPAAWFPRNLFLCGKSSQTTLIEQHVTIGQGGYLSSPVNEFVVDANAVVDHYRIQREAPDVFHMATLQLQQDRDSNFSTHTLTWGGALTRNDTNAVLDGEGCEATLNGLYMVEGTQLVDNHMRVEHAKPHCDSHELFKGILEGRSRTVFNGRIYVHKGAQKTDAKQTNRNLLLSKDALCNSNPQLEIFADDVKCTHGSTVGQLDETAIFYLRSRGIGEEAARSLLTYAFAADIVARIKFDPVRSDLEEFLFRRLPKGEIVRQAV